MQAGGTAGNVEPASHGMDAGLSTSTKAVTTATGTTATMSTSPVSTTSTVSTATLTNMTGKEFYILTLFQLQGIHTELESQFSSHHLFSAKFIELSKSRNQSDFEQHLLQHQYKLK